MLPWWVFAFASAIFATFFTIFRKKGTLKENALEFELTRTIFNALFGLLLLPFLTFKYTLTSILIIYFTSILASIGILLASKSLRHSEISQVIPLHNITPGFLAVLAFLFLGETLTRNQIIGLIFLIIGAYVLETEHHNPLKSFLKHLRSRYVDYAIISAFIFSVTALLDKYVINLYTTPFDFLFLIWIFIAINFMIISFISHNGIKSIKNCLKTTKHIVVLTAFFSFLANASYLYALSLTYVSLVMPISKLSILISTIIGGEIFHEKGILKGAISSVIMIIGTILIII